MFIFWVCILFDNILLTIYIAATVLLIVLPVDVRTLEANELIQAFNANWTSRLYQLNDIVTQPFDT